MAEMNKDEWRRQCVEMAKKPPLKPGRGCVLISREPSSTVLSRIERSDGTAVDLIGADRYKEPNMRGIVIALGAPKLTMMGGAIPFWVELGQLVTFALYAGKQYILGPHECVVMSEDEILAAVPTEK